MTLAYIIGFILISPAICLALALVLLIPLTIIDYLDEGRKRLKTRHYHKKELQYYEGLECTVRYMYDDSPWRW